MKQNPRWVRALAHWLFGCDPMPAGDVWMCVYCGQVWVQRRGTRELVKAELRRKGSSR